jgi:hypothetical protein
MTTPEEDKASEYIVSLWGRNRREFGRRYWAYLAYGMQEPPFTMCHGADHIARKLRAIGGLCDICGGRHPVGSAHTVFYKPGE